MCFVHIGSRRWKNGIQNVISQTLGPMPMSLRLFFLTGHFIYSQQYFTGYFQRLMVITTHCHFKETHVFPHCLTLYKRLNISCFLVSSVPYFNYLKSSFSFSE